MGYLLESSNPDELLVLIAGDRERPVPYHHDDQFPPVQGPGFCYLNCTDSLLELQRLGMVYPSRFQGFVVHLTWRGWDRVDELRALGVEPAPEVSCDEAIADRERHYARRVATEEPARRVRWWHRFRRTSTPEGGSHG